MKVKKANHLEDEWLIADKARRIIYHDIRLETALHEEIRSCMKDDSG